VKYLEAERERLNDHRTTIKEYLDSQSIIRIIHDRTLGRYLIHLVDNVDVLFSSSMLQVMVVVITKPVFPSFFTFGEMEISVFVVVK